MSRQVVINTAGHVDHGKSALVKALTGTDPDRLPEEKARGITIELGFAHLRLTTGISAVTLEVGIVDVPGHEDFVKNMIAGVGASALALLVVAADDGWMPQTEEHLQILAYLGVSRAVVALTKCDLAEGQAETMSGLIRERLRNSPFAEAPIVPVSVMSGLGLKELRASLAESLAQAPLPPDQGKPRLWVDRAFTLRGIGTVVTGTLLGGTLSSGQEVAIQPTGIVTRIRTIQVHNQACEVAGPGMRTALNLPAVETQTGNQKAAAGPGVSRGEVITLPNLGAAHDACDCLLERSARIIAGHPRFLGALKNGAPVRFYTGSANVPARLCLAERAQLSAGEQCLAQVRFDSPVYLFAGDRFVIRDWAEQITLAGGTVVEPRALRKHFAHADRLSCLHRQAEALTSPMASVESQLQRHRVCLRRRLLEQSPFSATEIAEAWKHLSAQGKVMLAGDWAVDLSEWKRLLERAGARIRAHHRAHPEQLGLPRAELLSGLGRDAWLPHVCDFLIAELLRTGFEQLGPNLKDATHQAALPGHLKAAGARIHAALSLKPFEPPSRKELASDAAGQDALRFLLQTGEVVQLCPEIVLLSASFRQATDLVRAFLRQHGFGTVSELRQVIGASRRVLVPLLEKLDRDGVTRREGDKRALKQPAPMNPCLACPPPR